MNAKNKGDQLATVTLSYWEWAELFEGAEENIVHTSKKRASWNRPTAEQMLPLLKAHTQVGKQAEKAGINYREFFQIVYHQALKLFNPGMCSDTKERYEQELASGGIVLLKEKGKTT